MIDFLPLHEVGDSADHSTNLGGVLMDHRLVGFAKSEAVEGFSLFFRASDATTNLSNLELGCHKEAPLAALDGVKFLAANACSLFGGAKIFKRVKGSFYDIVRVGGTEAFCQDIFDASGFKDGSNRPSRDNARSSSGGAKKDASGPEVTDHFVGNRFVDDGDLDHRTFGFVAAFADSFWDFVGFSEACADVTFAIADDDESVEGKATAAFYDFCGAGDKNDALFEIVAIFKRFHKIMLRCQRDPPRIPSRHRGHRLRGLGRGRDRYIRCGQKRLE